MRVITWWFVVSIYFFKLNILSVIQHVIRVHGEAHFLHDFVILSIPLLLSVFKSRAKGKGKFQRSDINVLNKT